MNKKTIFYVGLYAVAAYGAYYMFFSKSAYVKTIKKTNNYGGTAEELKNLVGKNFLMPWAKAAKDGVPTFLFEGKTYNTKGGKIVR
jgi:hypothetical protein